MAEVYTTRTVKLPMRLWVDLRAVSALKAQKMDKTIEDIIQKYSDQCFENDIAEWRENRKKEDAARQDLKDKAYAPLTDEGEF